MWDDRYNKEEYVYGTKANDFLIEQYKRIPAHGRVLCMAEGEGRNAVFLAEQGFEVMAIDLSQVGLDKAQKLASERGVSITTQVADLAEYDLGKNKWDGIVSIWAHMPEVLRQGLHARVSKALKSEGIFILEAYTQEQLESEGVGGPSADQIDKFMSLEKLKNELKDLQMVVGQEIQREIDEGKGHSGLSAVVQFVGVKP